MGHYYDMGREHLALAGMDDAGEMSAWYVFNAMGLYTYSPADPQYIVTVPLFDKVRVRMGDGSAFTVSKEGNGRRIRQITCGKDTVEGYFVSHNQLIDGKELIIKTE